jgi:hypothetical protein
MDWVKHVKMMNYESSAHEELAICLCCRFVAIRNDTNQTHDVVIIL